MRNAVVQILKPAAVVLMALTLVAFIAACGGSSGASDDGTGGGDTISEHVDDDENAADEHTDADAGGDAGSTVHVTLNEWSITSAHGEAFETSAGEVLFEIHNDGAAPHDLRIIKTDLAADALPITDGVVDIEAAGEVVGGLVDPLPGGDIAVEEQDDLEPGSYVLLCSIPGHYQQGMNAGMTVQ